MAGPITGDLLGRQYLGLSNRADINNGFPPLGGFAVEAISFGNPSTVTLTANQIGTVFLFDSAAGIVYTLPAPAATPLGGYFDFLCTVSITSNSAKVLTDAATTFLLGGVCGTGTTVTNYPANGTTIRSVNGNGTTTGGVVGSRYRLTLINATQWLVSGLNLGTGTTATPFATS
jgi:hypothetical protein